MKRFLLTLPMLAMTGAAFAQSSGPSPSQLDQIRAELATIQSRYQNQTGQPMFNPGGQAATSTPVTQAADNAANQAGEQAKGAGSKVSDKIKSIASSDPEPYTGPTAKIPIAYVAEGQLDMSPNSDYPGPWWGHLTRPIYSIDRTKILFPEGTTISGHTVRISGANEAINNRMGLMPEHLTIEDGHSFKINRQEVLDQLGIAGIPGEVDYHLGVQLAAIGAFAAVDSLPNILQANAGANPSVQGTFLQQSSDKGGTILQRYMSLVPTVQPKVGDPIRLFFSEEMLTAPVAHPVDRFQLTNISGATPPVAQQDE